MKKRILRITIGLMFLTGLILVNKDKFDFLKPSIVEAVGDLVVSWGVPEGDPIFNVSNMAPGQSEERTVSVQNNASTNRQVAIKGLKKTETGGLAQAFTIVINDGTNDLYGGSSPTGPKTIQQFFDESAFANGIPLSTISTGATANYKITAKFKEDSGNEYQNKQLTFDLKIGINVDMPPECLTMVFDQVIYGTERRDNLRGGPGTNLIIGLGANDIINGGSERDCVLGGNGSDIIFGNENDDVIDGGASNDILYGGVGNDVIYGGLGIDTIRGDDGNDKLYGDAAADTINGCNGDDTIYGGIGNDYITGDMGNDTIYGEGGDDRLYGNPNNDYLDGGIGNNLTHGGTETDTCLNGTKIQCEL